MIPALVLAAGLATRLRPLSLVRAKSALPVAGEPLARRIIRGLAMQGVTDVVINLHHLPHTITARLGDGADLGVRIRYSWEAPQVLGSAGGPRRALPLLDAPTFLIVNGDTLTDVDVGAMLAQHRTTHALVTMGVVPHAEPGRYGGLAVDDRGAVTGVVPRGVDRPSFHFLGVQVVEARAFAGLADNTPSESVGALYPDLLTREPGSVRACVTSASFMDIGTPADYLRTSLHLADREGRDLHDLHAGARVAPTARVEASVLWDDVQVGEGAWLRECVVTDGVRVPADTSWHGVTMRVAAGPLAPHERSIDGLAIGSI